MNLTGIIGISRVKALFFDDYHDLGENYFSRGREISLSRLKKGVIYGLGLEKKGVPLQLEPNLNRTQVLDKVRSFIRDSSPKDYNIYIAEVELQNGNIKKS